MADFDDFQIKTHFDDHGNITGHTQKGVNGETNYYDSKMEFKGFKMKNPFDDHSSYYDSHHKFIGKGMDSSNGHFDFQNADGSFGHYPKMMEIKSPDFHIDAHNHFKNIRTDILGHIK